MVFLLRFLSIILASLPVSFTISIPMKLNIFTPIYDLLLWHFTWIWRTVATLDINLQKHWVEAKCFCLNWIHMIVVYVEAFYQYHESTFASVTTYQMLSPLIIMAIMPVNLLSLAQSNTLKPKFQRRTDLNHEWLFKQTFGKNDFMTYLF